MFKKLLGNSSGELPSEIKNPFSMENVEEIHLHCTKKWFGDGFNIWGTIQFKNGNTTGKQEFKGDSLGDVFMKIHKFCEKLGVNR